MNHPPSTIKYRGRLYKQAGQPLSVQEVQEIIKTQHDVLTRALNEVHNAAAAIHNACQANPVARKQVLPLISSFSANLDRLSEGSGRFKSPVNLLGHFAHYLVSYEGK